MSDWLQLLELQVILFYSKTSIFHHLFNVLVTLFVFFTIGPSDYGSSITVYFARCAKEACGTISINDDSIMEKAEEEFIVSLQSANADPRVRVSARTSTVKITDDDGGCM